MLLEFSSNRPPGPAPAGRRWQRSYWPGGATIVAGLALYPAGGEGTAVLGQLVAVVGCCVLGNAVIARRRLTAATDRESRQWTIDDDGLRCGDRLGSVYWSWIRVHRVVEHPDVYLLFQGAGASFDIPRDPLTADQDRELRAFLAGRGLLPAA